MQVPISLECLVRQLVFASTVGGPLGSLTFDASVVVLNVVSCKSKALTLFQLFFNQREQVSQIMASHVIYVTISDNIRHAAVPIPSSVDDSHFHHVVQEPHRTGRCLQHFHCGESVPHCQELHCGEHSLEMTQSVTSFFNIRRGDFKLLFLLSLVFSFNKCFQEGSRTQY